MTRLNARSRIPWARCRSGALGRRKTAVEDLLGALSLRLADEPRLPGDLVYVRTAQAKPLLRFARMGAIMCHAAGHEDAAGRFVVALTSVNDVADLHSWPFRSEWRPNWLSASDLRCGVTVPAQDLLALVAAARYWASTHWPGIAEPIAPDIRSRGTCSAPPLATCTRGSVQVCGASGAVTSSSGWTC